MSDEDGLAVLRQGYEEYVAAFGLGEALARELEFEDDYQERVQGFLKRAGLTGVGGDYAGPLAFCGGAQAVQDLLEAVSSAMHVAGRQVPADVLGLLAPSAQYEVSGPALMFSGLVPEGDLGVVTRPPGVALFDVGEWFFLRLAAQAVATEMQGVTGSDAWGPDRGSQAVNRLRERLDGYLRQGEALRDNTYVDLMRGPREAFRRSLNLACVAWILGHEYGHLQLQPRLPHPELTKYSEAAEMASQDLEFRADRIADALVLTPHFRIHPLAAVFAPILVNTLQAYALRSRHFAGHLDQYWTHGDPELRAGMSVEALSNLGDLVGGKDKAEALYQAGHRFRIWMWGRFDTEEMWREDVPEGVSR